MLASLPQRRQNLYHPQQQYPQTLTIPQQDQPWTSNSISTISTPQPQYHATANNIFSFGADQPLFDYQPQQYDSSPSMPSEHNTWPENGILTPRSATRAYHNREGSLSSLGSAGPSSPFTANTSNPDIYHDLTPAHTPSQEQFLTPQYSNFYPNSHLAFTMGHDGLPKSNGDAMLMPAPEFKASSNHDSQTPRNLDGERQKSGEISSRFDSWLNDYLQLCDPPAYQRPMPKLDRTMTDVYADELYNPSFQITSAPSNTTSVPALHISPQNDVFTQRLQAASNQHLRASNTTPLTIPSRERSPFRNGSPLAPAANSFGAQSPNVRFGTAAHMRERMKQEDDARALQRQLERTSPERSAPKTISPKDVDLVYMESEESNTPLFPPQTQRQSTYRQQPAVSLDETDDSISQHSYGSMATSRRSSEVTQQQGQFNFVPPAVPGGIRQIPQQYPFVPQSRRQPSNLSNTTEDFPATLTSMESSSSEYEAPEASDKKPSGSSADTGTYTCTYHGCTLRFDTPAKLQRHKREGHRNSASVIGGGEGGGMTSAAQRNSQAGPHKCERINPSTGKPCNTIFSRPYDLTRHEDTIHNARKQKVHCPLCTEEKSFSRHDALTRHLRVVHPEHVDLSKSRRRAGHNV